MWDETAGAAVIPHGIPHAESSTAAERSRGKDVEVWRMQLAKRGKVGGGCYQMGFMREGHDAIQLRQRLADKYDDSSWQSLA